MSLTLSWGRSLSYRNQSIDLLWFLYERDLCHEWVKGKFYRVLICRVLSRAYLSRFIACLFVGSGTIWWRQTWEIFKKVISRKNKDRCFYLCFCYMQKPPCMSIIEYIETGTKNPLIYRLLVSFNTQYETLAVSWSKANEKP